MADLVVGSFDEPGDRSRFCILTGLGSLLLLLPQAVDDEEVLRDCFVASD